MKIVVIFWFVTLGIIFVSCTKPYMPEVTTINNNLLVVEGHINVGSDSTIITLSRTQLISDKNKNRPEIGAVVTVESDANDKYVLPEKSPGKYAAPALNLSVTKKYRLSIRTTKSVTYLSDFVEAKITPPIDSLNYQVMQNGVQLFVNTHDDDNQSIYYRWNYTETWEFFSAYYSFLIWKGNTMQQRDIINNDISRCWGTNSNSPITLGSTAKLGRDIVYNGPLTFLNSDSEKLSSKYSILVRQYALTKDAYEFWEELKKNTESLGSIFDPQPSQIGGNIHNVANANEPVIGYVSAGTFQEKRIFILKDKLPPWRTTAPFDCLIPDTVLVPNFKAAFESGLSVPLIEVVNANGNPGVAAGPRACVDCTLRGTNKRPTFWQ